MKFKVGDKVRYYNAHNDSAEWIEFNGTKGEVINCGYYSDSPIVTVEFEKEIPFGEELYTIRVHKTSLKLIEKQPNHPLTKIFK